LKSDDLFGSSSEFDEEKYQKFLDEFDDEFDQEEFGEIDEALIREVTFEAPIELYDENLDLDALRKKLEQERKEEEKRNSKSAIKKPLSIHHGHRARVIKKFLDYGLESFAEHEVLELLLFFTRRQGDTNALAHRLIQEFGGLHNVIKAEPHDLETVDGVGENTATLICFFRSLMAYLSEKSDIHAVINNATAAGIFCCNFFTQHTEETFIVLHMDANNGVRHISVISRGTENETAYYPRKVIKEVIKHRANSVIVAHNHTSNNLQPSAQDVHLTNRISTLLDEIGVPLTDHIICSGRSFTSMQERGLITK